MFRSKKDDSVEKQLTREAVMDVHLLRSFSEICVKKCTAEKGVEEDLSTTEKICLGKCIDRGYDYLRIVEKVNL